MVSEVMLQQTQARRVIPKWHAFLSEYPTPASCAAAPLADVLRRWHGLGYPRRARDLHTAARHIVERCQAGCEKFTVHRPIQQPARSPKPEPTLNHMQYLSDLAVIT